MKVECLVSFLSWNGMIVSMASWVTIFISQFLTIVAGKGSTSKMVNLTVIYYAIWFAGSFKLLRAENKMQALKRICNSMYILELVLNILVGVFVLWMVFLSHGGMTWIWIGLLTICLIHTLFCSLLLIGLRTLNSLLIKIFINYSVIALIFGVCVDIAAAVYLNDNDSLPLTISELLFYTLIAIYGFISIRGYVFAFRAST